MNLRTSCVLTHGGLSACDNMMKNSSFLKSNKKVHSNIGGVFFLLAMLRWLFLLRRNSGFVYFFSFFLIEVQLP